MGVSNVYCMVSIVLCLLYCVCSGRESRGKSGVPQGLKDRGEREREREREEREREREERRERGREEGREREGEGEEMIKIYSSVPLS